jgi:hypothetical protein
MVRKGLRGRNGKPERTVENDPAAEVLSGDLLGLKAAFEPFQNKAGSVWEAITWFPHSPRGMLAGSQLSLGGAPVERLDDGAEAVLVDAFPIDRGPANIGVCGQVSGNMSDIG